MRSVSTCAFTVCSVPTVAPIHIYFIATLIAGLKAIRHFQVRKKKKYQTAVFQELHKKRRTMSYSQRPSSEM